MPEVGAKLEISDFAAAVFRPRPNFVADMIGPVSARLEIPKGFAAFVNLWQDGDADKIFFQVNHANGVARFVVRDFLNGWL
jgi:hypothetical protein